MLLTDRWKWEFPAISVHPFHRVKINTWRLFIHGNQNWFYNMLQGTQLKYDWIFILIPNAQLSLTLLSLLIFSTCYYFCLNRLTLLPILKPRIQTFRPHITSLGQKYFTVNYCCRCLITYVEMKLISPG